LEIVPMPDHASRHRLSLGILAGASVLLLGTGSALGWWKLAPQPAAIAPKPEAPVATAPESTVSPEPSIAVAPPSAPATEQAPTAAEKQPEVYWLKSSDSKVVALAPQPAAMAPVAAPTQKLETAMMELLAGPKEATTETTTIPAGTKLRKVEVKPDGIHIDLSQEFTAGGGTTSMTGRVGQVLYTATSVDPNAKVWISIEGKPLETLGGEGLVLEQPMTRDRFQQDFPSQQ
jgi:spore germination protein GerM